MPEKTGKKQRIAAVICELNPLHFGHEALFRQAKRHAQGLVYSQRQFCTAGRTRRFG